MDQEVCPGAFACTHSAQELGLFFTFWMGALISSKTRLEEVIERMLKMVIILLASVTT